MTKYTLSFTKKASKFIVTYDNGQFKRLEYKSGGMAENHFRYLTQAIPIDEHLIPKVMENYDNRVVFEKIEQSSPESQFTKFMRMYFLFVEELTGIKPKVTAIEGSCLKQIITYLNDLSATEDETYSIWSQLLNNWSKIEPFYAKQTNLKQINSNITTLLIQVKNGADRKTQADRDADVLRKSI